MPTTLQPGLQPLYQSVDSPYQDAQHLTIGRVVATHQDTHTLDIELLSGGRLTHVPVVGERGGRDEGNASLPAVTPGSGRAVATGRQDVYALVGFLNGSLTTPIVLGLIGPKDSTLARRPSGSAMERYSGGASLMHLADGTLESRVPGGRLRFGPADDFASLPSDLEADAGAAAWVLEIGGVVFSITPDGVDVSGGDLTVDGLPIAGGGGGAPSGPAGGDLSGTYPNPTVAQLQGRPVDATAPTTGQALIWNGSAYAPGTAGQARIYTETFGDGSNTVFLIAHNFGTRDVNVQVYEAADPYYQIYPDVSRDNTNYVTLYFATAPTTDQYRVVVMG